MNNKYERWELLLTIAYFQDNMSNFVLQSNLSLQDLYLLVVSVKDNQLIV